MSDQDETGPRPAYQVLARKYRPQSFDDLIGHGAMVRTLRNAFATGRIAHAFVLTGVRGVGKTTTARILARALNYVGPDGDDTGPTVDMSKPGIHCRAIAESRHPDVLEMDAASRTGVNDIRELIDGVRYAPVEARYKVYIIDEVHMLSTAAFNALLKTLEEPPAHVKFIFATTEIRKLPVTVLSRCQRFDLRRIDPETLTAHLAHIAEREGVSVDPDGLAMIARAAEGSVRDGLSILDQALIQHDRESKTAVSASIIRDMLGLADRSRVWDLLEATLSAKAEEALALFREQYDGGAEPSVVMKDLLELVHLLTRVKAAGPEAATHGPAGEADAARARDLASRLELNVLTRVWSLLMKGLGETNSAPDPASAAEIALIRIIFAAELPTPDDALRQLKRASGAAPVPDTASPASQGASPASSQAPGHVTTRSHPSGGEVQAVGSAVGAASDHTATTDIGSVAGLAADRGGVQRGVAGSSENQVMSARIETENNLAVDQDAPYQPGAQVIDTVHRHDDPASRRKGDNPIAETPADGSRDWASRKSPSRNGQHLKRFEDIVRLAGEKRDAKLRVELESYAHVISFEPRRIELRLAEAAPADLSGRLVQRLKDWTGDAWSVTLNSSERGAPTLRDARFAEAMAHPIVARAFDVFPDTEIIAIRDSNLSGHESGDQPINGLDDPEFDDESED